MRFNSSLSSTLRSHAYNMPFLFLFLFLFTLRLSHRFLSPCRGPPRKAPDSPIHTSGIPPNSTPGYPIFRPTSAPSSSNIDITNQILVIVLSPRAPEAGLTVRSGISGNFILVREDSRRLPFDPSGIELHEYIPYAIYHTGAHDGERSPRVRQFYSTSSSIFHLTLKPHGVSLER